MTSRLSVTTRPERDSFCWANTGTWSTNLTSPRRLLMKRLLVVTILRLNAKAEGDAAAMRQKYETDAVAKAEELEMTKMKLSARNTEAEAAIDNLNAKLAQIEKAKSKIQ